MADSAARSREFYRRLGPAGLAIRTKPEWDRRTVADLRGLIPASGRVLDVGCGYGRISLPLAALGYAVTGVDIAPNLLRAARHEAAQQGLGARFDEASMTSLPYEDASFDIVISLWSAFYELLEPEEQETALREMTRVLAPGGTGIVEGPTFSEATPDDVRTGRRHGPDKRLIADEISGHRTGQYAHDRQSLLRVASAAALPSPRVMDRAWGGRTRQVLLFGGGVRTPEERP